MKKIIKILLTILSFSILIPASSANSESKKTIESKIVKTIQSNQKDALKFLLKVVNINSGTMNFSGVKKVADLFEQKFQQLGFKTEWVSATKYHRSGHFIASYGSQGPKILMIGHMDTVFAVHSPFQKASQISETQIRGPGISDMKGGDVVILEVLRALKESKQLDKFQIKVILMGDEESRGSPVKGAAKILTDAGVWADIALGFEDGDGNPKTAVISRRGSSNWHIKSYGNAAHSSQIFQAKVGYGSIYEAARILNQFRIELADEKLLTYNPGLIFGGTTAELSADGFDGKAFGKKNVVAKITEVSGDIRAISPQQLKRAKNKMEQIAKNSLPGTHSEFVFTERYPPMAVTPGNKKLLALYSKVSEEFGFGKVIAVNPRNAGAADISFVAADVDMAMDGLGLMGSGGHTVKETAEMDTFSQQTIRATILMLRLLEVYTHAH